MSISANVLCLLLVGGGEAAQPSASSVLEAYEHWLTTMNRVEFRAAITTYWLHEGIPGAKFPTETEFCQDLFSCRRDGDRWRIEHTHTGTSEKDGTTYPIQSHKEYVFPDTTHKALMRVQNDRAQYEDQEESVWRVTVNYEATSENERPSYVHLHGAGFFYGYLSGDGLLALPEVLRDSKLSVEPDTQTIDGHETIVLLSVGKFGERRIWLDPTLGYVPRRLEIIRRGNDYTNNRTVASYDGKGSGELGGFWPSLPMREMRTVIDSVKIDDVGGTAIVAALQKHQIYSYAGGGRLTIREDMTFSDVNLEPEFSDESFTVQFEIPDGAAVTVENAPGIAYHWIGGEIIEGFDPNALAELSGLTLGGTMGQRRVWLVVISLSAILLVAAVLILRARRASAN